MKDVLKVVLAGNPNTGKSSIFNALTGLRQSVVNYPGATVEKKKGFFTLADQTRVSILDLPGTYSLNASSPEEHIAAQVIINRDHPEFPDVAVVVADVENLKRNLVLFTQIKDLGIATILAINMADLMEKKAITIDIAALEQKLNTKIALISTRKNTGLDELKTLLANHKDLPTKPCTDVCKLDKPYLESLAKSAPQESVYRLWLMEARSVYDDAKSLANDASAKPLKTPLEQKHLIQKETIARYVFVKKVLDDTYAIDSSNAKDLRSVLDRILMHRVYGYFIFFVLLFLMFQAIFNWSSYPMDLIDLWFSQLSSWLQETLPGGKLSQLLSAGIVPGIGGVVVFIPQIAFLSLFISILEETGYISRIVFLMDKTMRKVGLSGKSVIALISGTACAIPAIMSTRHIEGTKERLISILVTPFVTCSARLPVYLILIALVIPNKTFLGIGLQGAVLMGLYGLGFGAAIGSAYILNKTLKFKYPQHGFVAEMPNYKVPLIKNVLLAIFEKTKGFVWGAGKVILSVSVLLWFLASHGPGDFSKTDTSANVSTQNQLPKANDAQTASEKLEHSYIGLIGKALEPALSPLGYDWKIGIAIVTSFVAREVFVGTLSVIYNANEEDESTIKNRMAEDINHNTGKPLFNLASGVSLLLFYAFSMQCVSTLAVTKKETNNLKWPLLQFGFMTVMAYVSAMVAYQFLKVWV